MSDDECSKSFDGQYMGARIGSIFVLLVVSAAGSFAPILAIKYQTLGVPSWVIYVARYFGSGVILATAFIHLLGESTTSFASPCLSEAYKEYLWGSALALMGVFTMFTIELVTERLMHNKFKRDALEASQCSDSILEDDEEMLAYLAKKSRSQRPSLEILSANSQAFDLEALDLEAGRNFSRNVADSEPVKSAVHIVQAEKAESIELKDNEIKYSQSESCSVSGTLPVDENSSENGKTSSEDDNTSSKNDTHAFQKIFNIFLLEFGIIFHSIFVGLSLAVAGEQFVTLFIAISFHQFFEGMGLGARFATTKWPPRMSRFPLYLCLAYSLTTPIGIAAGLGVRHLYSNNDNTSLIVVGIFDGFCSGLLIYSCLIEFMGRDFLMDDEMKERTTPWVILAYAMFFLGTLFMALVGNWA